MIVVVDLGLLLVKNRWQMRTGFSCDRCKQSLGTLDVERAVMKLSSDPAGFRRLEVEADMKRLEAEHKC